MNGRITRKNSPTETIDHKRVINRSLLTSDIRIILLSLHYTFRLIYMIFYPPHFHPVKFLNTLMNKNFDALLEILFQQISFPHLTGQVLYPKGLPPKGQVAAG